MSLISQRVVDHTSEVGKGEVGIGQLGHGIVAFLADEGDHEQRAPPVAVLGPVWLDGGGEAAVGEGTVIVEVVAEVEAHHVRHGRVVSVGIEADMLNARVAPDHAQVAVSGARGEAEKVSFNQALVRLEFGVKRRAPLFRSADAGQPDQPRPCSVDGEEEGPEVGWRWARSHVGERATEQLVRGPVGLLARLGAVGTALAAVAELGGAVAVTYGTGWRRHGALMAEKGS